MPWDTSGLSEYLAARGGEFVPVGTKPPFPLANVRPRLNVTLPFDVSVVFGIVARQLGYPGTLPGELAGRPAGPNTGGSWEEIPVSGWPGHSWVPGGSWTPEQPGTISGMASARTHGLQQFPVWDQYAEPHTDVVHPPLHTHPWSQITATPTTLAGYGITDAQPLDDTLTAIAGLPTDTDTIVYFTAADTASLTTLTPQARALLDDTSAAAMRATLELGTIATQNANAVSITGGTIAGITDLAIADGGTGASDAAGARANLGVPPTTRTIATTHSLTGGGDLSADRTLSLVGDSASPGNSMYYGTNSAGTRGWYPLPSSSSPFNVDITDTSDRSTSENNSVHPVLQFDVSANEVWYIELRCAMSASGNTPALNLGITSSWTNSRSWNRGVHYNSSGALTNRAPTAAASTTLMVSGNGLVVGESGATARPVVFDAVVSVAASGTVRVLFGVGGTAGTGSATFHAGCRLRAIRVRQ